MSSLSRVVLGHTSHHLTELFLAVLLIDSDTFGADTDGVVSHRGRTNAHTFSKLGKMARFGNRAATY